MVMCTFLTWSPFSFYVWLTIDDSPADDDDTVSVFTTVGCTDYKLFTIKLRRISHCPSSVTMTSSRFSASYTMNDTVAQSVCKKQGWRSQPFITNTLPSVVPMIISSLSSLSTSAARRLFTKTEPGPVSLWTYQLSSKMAGKFLCTAFPRLCEVWWSALCVRDNFPAAVVEWTEVVVSAVL